ncbi:MAG: isochorismatase family protein, partial [Armatimonadota bacterium]
MAEDGNALLVIDMLNDFIEPDGALYIGETGRKIIAPIRARLDDARRRAQPVVYVCDRHRPDDA